MTLQPTMLFVPGSDQRKLDKIPGITASAFIIDLEDAVAVSVKAAARTMVAAALQVHGATCCLYVRINSMETQLWEEDVTAVAVPGLHGINLPKVVNASQIAEIDAVLLRLEQERALPPGAIDLMATVETVAGIRHLDAIAAASPRLRRLCFGAGDFSLDLGIDWPPPTGALSPTLLAAKVAVVMASRYQGLEPPHDGVFPRLHDDDGLRAETLQAQALGFFGKHAIHPAQLPIIDSVFYPSPAQVTRASDIVRSFEESERTGNAAIQLDGQFIDYPVVARARQILALAQGQSERPDDCVVVEKQP